MTGRENLIQGQTAVPSGAQDDGKESGPQSYETKVPNVSTRPQCDSGKIKANCFIRVTYKNEPGQ
jgi:hypothetical protein